MLARSVCKVASSSAGTMSSTRAVGPEMPALFTSTSSPPRRDSAASMNASSSASCPASARTPGCPQAASAASSTSDTNTAAPQAAKLSAMTRPIPPAPAVIATRRAVRSRGTGVRAPWGMVGVLWWMA